MSQCDKLSIIQTVLTLIKTLKFYNISSSFTVEFHFTKLKWWDPFINTDNYSLSKSLSYHFLIERNTAFIFTVRDKQKSK